MSSWTATMQLARRERQQRRTTELHATELRDLARKSLEESRKTLSSQTLSADERRRASAALDSLSVAILDMDHELLAP